MLNRDWVLHIYYIRCQRCGHCDPSHAYFSSTEQHYSKSGLSCAPEPKGPGLEMSAKPCSAAVLSWSCAALLVSARSPDEHKSLTFGIQTKRIEEGPDANTNAGVCPSLSFCFSSFHSCIFQSIWSISLPLRFTHVLLSTTTIRLLLLIVGVFVCHRALNFVYPQQYAIQVWICMVDVRPEVCMSPKLNYSAVVPFCIYP